MTQATVATVAMQTFLVVAVCWLFIDCACSAWSERQARKAAQAEWLRRLCAGGLLWRAR